MPRSFLTLFFICVSLLTPVLRVRIVGRLRCRAAQADLPLHRCRLPVQGAEGDARLSSREPVSHLPLFQNTQSLLWAVVLLLMLLFSFLFSRPEITHQGRSIGWLGLVYTWTFLCPPSCPLPCSEPFSLLPVALYCPWRGQLSIRGQLVCSIALRTPFSSTIPAQL